MMKVLLGVMGGVFVGAFLMEMLRAKRPLTVERIQRRASERMRNNGLPIIVEYERAE